MYKLTPRNGSGQWIKAALPTAVVVTKTVAVSNPVTLGLMALGGLIVGGILMMPTEKPKKKFDIDEYLKNIK